MYNDYFAETHLRLSDPNDHDQFRFILRSYSERRIKRIILAVNYSDSESCAIHKSDRRELLYNAQKLASHTNVKIKAATVFDLDYGISRLPMLQSLAFDGRSGKYVFLRILPTTDPDMIPAELHGIIYRQKLIPVITCAERAAASVPDRSYNSILNIPNAVYQINISSLQSTAARKFARRLIMRGKTVVFGSGDKFDQCVYGSDYYTKFLSEVVGSDKLGYYALRHNAVFD